MKKIYWVLVIIVILVAGWIFVRFILGGSEDSWIKDSKGIYVEHGDPFGTPDYVAEQQNAVICALDLYAQEKNKGTEFNSKCLGTCNNFAVDVVHVPRTAEDNLIENQCSDYRDGKVGHFIELDKDGNIFRIA